MPSTRSHFPFASLTTSAPVTAGVGHANQFQPQRCGQSTGVADHHVATDESVQTSHVRSAASTAGCLQMYIAQSPGEQERRCCCSDRLGHICGFGLAPDLVMPSPKQGRLQLKLSSPRPCSSVNRQVQGQSLLHRQAAEIRAAH